MNPLKELRKKRGLSGLQMAVILGIVSPYYYSMELGACNLSESTLNKLKKEFNIDPEDFKKRFEEWRLQKKKELLSIK
jgi:transcriptional regulator with XRE-family HTH domain